MQETGERHIHGDYLALETNGVREVEGTIADSHTVRYFHRSFSRMIEDILASGFTIKQLIEPAPLEAMREANEQHYQQVSKQPKFLIWVLQK